MMSVNLNDVQTEILSSRTPAFAIYAFFHVKNSTAFKLFLRSMVSPSVNPPGPDVSLAPRIVSEKTGAELNDQSATTQIGFTMTGLRALQIDRRTLTTFPEPFQQGMAARAKLLDDTGESAPENWHGYLARPTFMGCCGARSHSDRGSTIALLRMTSRINARKSMIEQRIFAL
jgi:hypothetical protein